MKRLLITALALCPFLAQAQNITGFLDYMDRFFVFDRGTITQLEPQKPIAFASGGDYLIYAATGGDLKVYRDGQVRTIDQGIATTPTITDHFFGYVSAGALKIFDGDSLRVLCRNTGASIVKDSIAAFYDEVQHTLQIYYDGTITPGEDALMENPVQKWSAGDNTLAWINKATLEFKIFQHGQLYVPASLVSNMRFTAGLDMVAFEDPSDRGLKVFEDGNVTNLEPVMPDSIFMGRGLFAYIDRSGALKVYQNGSLHTAMDFTPTGFFVKDSLVVINDNGYCKIFHDGSTGSVLSFWPNIWEANWGSFVYVDNGLTVNIWRNGIISTVMQRQPVKQFRLDHGLLTLVGTNNQVKIWWNGKLYEH